MIHAAAKVKGKIDATEYDTEIEPKRKEVQEIEEKNKDPRLILVK